MANAAPERPDLRLPSRSHSTVTVPCPVLITRPAEGRRLGGYQPRWDTHERSPIPVLTGLDVEQPQSVHCWQPCFSGCCSSSLEQYGRSRRLIVITADIPSSFKNSSFLIYSHLILDCQTGIVTVVLVVMFRYLGHSKNLCLLTYLLIVVSDTVIPEDNGSSRNVPDMFRFS